MRWTWFVIVLVVAGAAFALVRLSGSEEPVAPRPSAAASGPGPVSLQRSEPEGPAPTASPADGQSEARARDILTEVAAAHDARDRARYDRAVQALEKEAWDAPSARRFALRLGWGAVAEAEQKQGIDRMRLLDRGRRLLSRAVDLDESFAADGSPTADRVKLVAAIQKANQEVMG